METTEVKNMDEAKKLGYVIYGLYASSLLIGITAIVAFILNFLSREKVKGTIVESHYAYQKRTFIIAVIVKLVGLITAIIGIGVLICIAAYLWYAYRIVKGGWYLYDNKEIGAKKMVLKQGGC
jgi:uncharacterized membrane protein